MDKFREVGRRGLYKDLGSTRTGITREGDDNLTISIIILDKGQRFWPVITVKSSGWQTK